jgi:hypothetical protein
MDDAYLGGERPGGKRGRGAAGKTPIIATVETTAARRPKRLRLSVVKGFRKREVEKVAKRDIAPGSDLASDGLSCWPTVEKAGCPHRPVVTGSGEKAASWTPFKRVNTHLGNITARAARRRAGEARRPRGRPVPRCRAGDGRRPRGTDRGRHLPARRVPPPTGAHGGWEGGRGGRPPILAAVSRTPRRAVASANPGADPPRPRRQAPHDRAPPPPPGEHGHGVAPRPEAEG